MRIPDGLVEALRAARHAAVITGAGISAESGMPTFRDAQTGLWARYRPEDLATPEAFDRDPKLVWDWYTWRRELARRAAPNAGHLALAEMARFVPNLTLITQNVDGLHQRAGSAGVIELHGNIHRTKCSRETGVLVESWPEDGEEAPRCPRCGAYLRPDVIWFGEALPAAALEAAVDAAEDCDIFFSIGTSGVVQPAASLAFAALQHGGPVVEINPQRTPLTGYATYRLHGPAGEVLPELVTAAWRVG